MDKPVNSGAELAGGGMAPTDFFISYAGADQVWAEWIADTLERAEYSTVLQKWDFRPGENFILRMDQALDEARRVLAVMSPAYFRSKWTREEWAAALARDHGHDDLVLVRVMPATAPPMLAGRVYIDLVGLQEGTAAERLLAGIQAGRARPAGRRPFPGAGSSDAGGAGRFPGRQPAIFNVRPRNLFFTGRDELLRNIRRDLGGLSGDEGVRACAVHGLGGVGKTQLAIEYAHRFASDYDMIWWIPAEDPGAIPGRLAALARRLELPQLPELEDQMEAVFDELGQRRRWLLVYDNATEPIALDGLRPPAGGGHLLLTSQNPAWRGVATTISVGELDHDEAISFLRQRTGSSEQLPIERLAAELGDLPLALEQAAAYLEANSTPPGEYVQLLHERTAELLSFGQPVNYPRTVASTWSVSLELLRQQTPVAEDLLQLCAFLAPDDIPRSMLQDHAQVLPGRLREAIEERIGYHQGIGTLTRYSLLAATGDSMSVHRLVQAVVRSGLDEDAIRCWTGASVRLVQAAFPAVPEQVDAWPQCARLLPHALAVTAPARDAAEPAATARLLGQAGRYLSGRADYAQAKELLERALAICESRVGPDHLDTAECLSNLALVLYNLRDLERACRLHERALHIRETQLPPDRPDIARSLTNLGAALRPLDKLARARELHERALVIFEASLGPEHPETARCLKNLALVLRALHSFAEARKLHDRALEIREATLGPDHPDTASSLSNLALVLHDQGDLDGARARHERALQIRETRLGPNHPLTARSLHNVANILHRQGDLDRARSMHERALEIRENRLGPDHTHTARSLASLAGVICDQGDQDTAHRLYERALAVYEHHLPAGHPDAAGIRQALAAIAAP